MLPMLVAAALAAASPAPTAPPLRTIVHESISPLCTTLKENVGHAMQAAMANDQAIAASKPVFVSMAHDYMSTDVTAQNGWGNLHSVAAINHDATAMDMDTQHLQQIIDAVTHNLQLIQAQLSDPNRFPKDPKTDAGKKALELKAQLEAIAAQQAQTLNFLNGVADTRNMEALEDRGDPLEQLFGIADLGPGQKANPKLQGTNTQFTGGPLTQTPADQFDPQLKPAEYSALSNSIFGRFYRIVFLEQNWIGSLEQPFAKNVVELAQRCNTR